MRLIYLLLILTIPFKVSAQIKPADQQYIPQENLLLNPGLEQGRVNWTISGTATVSLEQTASAVLAGLSSLKIVASSQTFEVAQFTTKSAASLNGMQAMASVRVKTNQSGVQVCSIENSVHVKCVSVDSTNQTKEYIIPFVFNSTNNGIVIKGASGTGTTYIDDAYVGIMPANRTPEIDNITQWVDYGAITITGTTTNPTKATTKQQDSVRCREVGENYECEYRYRADSAVGAAAGSGGYLFSLPTGIEFADDQSLGTIYTGTSTLTVAEASDASRYASRIGYGSVAAAGTVYPFNTGMAYAVSGNRFQVMSIYTSGYIPNSGFAKLTDNNLVYNFLLRFKGKNIGGKSKVYSGATIYPAAHVVGEVTYSSGSTLNIGGSPMQNNSMTVSSTGDVLNVCSNYSLGTGAGCVSGNKAVGASFPNKGRGTYEVCQSYGGHNTGATANSDLFTISGLTFNIGSGTPLQSFAGETWYFATNYGARISLHDYCVTIVDPTQDRINVTFNAPVATYSYAILPANNLIYTRVKYYPPKDNPIIGTFEGIEKCEDDFECTDTFSAKVSDTGVVSGENLDWINGNCTYSAGSVCTFNAGIFTVAPNCWIANTTSGINQSNVNGGQVYNLSSTGATFASIDAAGGSIVARNQTIYCQKTGSDYKPKTAKAATTNEMMYVPNVTRPKTCYYAFGGASATLASPTVCAASPCVEVVDNCSAGTAPTRASAGLYNDLTFANGTWKENSLLDCQCRSYRTVSGDIEDCLEYFVTGDNTWSTNASGGAVLNINNGARDGTARDAYVRITCTADAP